VARSLRLAWLLGLAAVALAELPVGTTKDLTRLREQPSATAAQVAVLPPGTRLQILGEMQGWKQVQTPEGKTGFVWAEHLSGASGPPPQATTRPPDAPQASELRDDVRELRDDVDALRARPEPATAADLEKLRGEVERLATTEREVARRLDEHGTSATPTAPPDPQGDPAGFSWVVLLVGIIAGWGGSRLALRRRERRQRGKLWW
jgi:SH3-like domain-containing protein